MPQPNLVPVIPRLSRSTHRIGVSGSASTFIALPLTVSVIITTPPRGAIDLENYTLPVNEPGYVGSSYTGLAISGFPSPYQCEPPADERHAEEQIDEEDRSSAFMLRDVGDEGWQEVDHQCYDDYRGDHNERDGGVVHPALHS